MKHEVWVLDADAEQCRLLCNIIEDKHFRPIPLDSLGALLKEMETAETGIAILSLDTISVDNRKIRELKKAGPNIRLIALSGRQLHPELEEALRVHIFAILKTPVDPEELSFLIMSAVEN